MNSKRVPYLFHLSEAESFAIDHEPASLKTEGFVHLSSADQVLRTAERWFQSASSLKLLVLEQEALGDKLRWEDLYQHGEEFPHLYGAIPSESMVAAAVLQRDPSGHFFWPTVLEGLRSPLLEPLTEESAVIEPTKRFTEKKLPELCLLCFFSEVLEGLASRPDCETFHGLGSEIGATEVYVLRHEGQSVAVCHPGVGGPLAAATLEELIALGCRSFLLCGGAGSLIPEQTMGHLVVVDQAWRDEGVSHHYLAPDKSIAVKTEVLQRIIRSLQERAVAFELGSTWTTDALYRETPSRIARRRGSGCLTVEMELASLLAVAQYRQCQLGAILYCGDDVGSEDWEFRDWTQAHSVRERLFALSLEVLVSTSDQ